MSALQQKNMSAQLKIINKENTPSKKISRPFDVWKMNQINQIRAIWHCPDGKQFSFCEILLHPG